MFLLLKSIYLIISYRISYFRLHSSDRLFQHAAIAIYSKAVSKSGSTILVEQPHVSEPDLAIK